MVNFNTDGKAILIVFIGAMIALALIAVIADSVFTETNAITVEDVNVTAPAPDTPLDVEGREIQTTIGIVNASNLSQSLVNNGSLLQTGLSSSTGLLTVQLLLNDSSPQFEGELVTLNYTALPDGYVSDAGGRSITLLIPIFAALAILVFVIVMFIKDGSLGKLIRREK